MVRTVIVLEVGKLGFASLLVKTEKKACLMRKVRNEGWRRLLLYSFGRK